MILNCIAGSKYSSVRILRMFYSLPVFGGLFFLQTKGLKSMRNAIRERPQSPAK